MEDLRLRYADHQTRPLRSATHANPIHPSVPGRRRRPQLHKNPATTGRPRRQSPTQPREAPEEANFAAICDSETRFTFQARPVFSRIQTTHPEGSSAFCQRRNP
jgi:hypothetical protein